MSARVIASVAVAAMAVSALTGCTDQHRVVPGSVVTIAVGGALTSLNPDDSSGGATALDADVAYLTGTSFAYPDDHDGLVRDTSFGTAVVTAHDPLTVRYTIADGVTWSDGVPVTPADLLLAWAGAARLGGTVDPGLAHATQPPQPGDDGRSLFLHLDVATTGWETALAPGLPAHIVGARALGLSLRAEGAAPTAPPDGARAEKAAAAVQRAILDDDADALGRIAEVWNHDYQLDGRTPDPELLVASGPYRVTAVAEDSVTLRANPRYHGSREPAIETLVLTRVDDPVELERRLAAGTIDIATPAADAGLAARLRAIDGVRVVAGSESTVEHLDLQFAESRTGAFGDLRVRQAFLDVVPRQRIVDELVVPVNPDAVVLDSFVIPPAADGSAATVADHGSADDARVDVAAATALLAAAGVSSPEVCILYDPADARRVAEFGLIRDSAALAGFRVTDCSRADWRGLLGVAGAYDAALFAWDTTPFGPTAISAVFRSDSTVANLNHFADAHADTLIDRLSATDEPVTRTALLAQLDSILWQQAYGVPLFAHPSLTVVSERVAHVTRSPLARGVFWNAWRWTPTSHPARSP